MPLQPLPRTETGSVQPERARTAVASDRWTDQTRSVTHFVTLTQMLPILRSTPCWSEILESDREGPQVWSGRPTVSDRSIPTLG